MAQHEVIDLSNKHLNDGTLSALAASLQSEANSFQCLQLYLAGNVITERGCPALSSLISHLPHLTQLDLSRNKLKGTSAARALAKTIEGAPTLRSLVLTGNEFGPHGTPIISEMFKKLSILRRLDLGWITWSKSEDGSITASGPAHSHQEESYSSY